MLVAGRINGEGEYIMAPLQTNSDALAKGWNGIKFFVPCQTFVNVKGNLAEDPEGVTFTSSEAEDTMSIFKAVKDVDMNVDEIFMNLVSKKLTPIAKLEEEHELVKEVWDRLFFVRGIVTSINTKYPDYQGRVTIRIMDPNDNGVEIKAKIPKGFLPLPFGEGSEVIAYGKSVRFNQKEEGTEKWVEADVGLEALGVRAIEGYATPSEAVEAEAVEDEAPIDGWQE